MMKLRSSTVWRTVIGTLFALFLLYSLLPLPAGHDHVGVWVCLGVAVAGVVLAAAWPAVWRLVTKRKAVLYVVLALVCIAALLVLLSLVAGGFMVAGALSRPDDEDKPVTVVVLGAAIRGDRPSRMLADRLRVAADYLAAHPQAVCVVSGGQGSDEDYPEGQVMKNYLVELGIEPDRVFTEETSTNTYENLAFSLDVIAREELPADLLIATQEFHQFRAAQYARRAGAQSVYALPCATPWYAVVGYWVREFAAISRMILLGY